MGRAGDTRQHFDFQRVLDDLPGAGWSIVGDLPGGTRQPFMTWGRWADTYLVLVEPRPASRLSERRLARLAEMVVAPRAVVLANKVRASSDAARVHERTGLEVVGEVPLDPAQAQADRQGVALLDHDRTLPRSQRYRAW